MVIFCCWFCVPILLTSVLHQSPPFSHVLYPSNCFIPNLCNVSPRSSIMGPALGAQKTSEEEEAVVPALLQRSQASAHRRLPAFIHLKNKIEGNRDKCTLCTEEITTNAALKRAKERNKLFISYLLGGKRTEDVLCRNRRTAFLLVISWKSNILRGNYGNNLNVQLLC